MKLQTSNPSTQQVETGASPELKSLRSVWITQQDSHLKNQNNTEINSNTDL